MFVSFHSLEDILIFHSQSDFRVKYQESSIGFENIAHLKSIENKYKGLV